MTSRERILTAIDHKELDRPPAFVTLTPLQVNKRSSF
jgi:hypothetical protein